MSGAVVLLSGGQDSATCLFWARREFGGVHAVGFDYGQRHRIELEYAAKLCGAYDLPFHVIDAGVLNTLTVNALTRADIPVQVKEPDSLPNTFVDGRNLLFLSLAAVYAKGIDAPHLVTGVCETDFSGYPDCRDVFIKSLNVTLNLAMDYRFVIHTPLMWKNKAQTWALAEELGVLDVIRTQTVTCYNGIPADGCGECPACVLRRRGWEAFQFGRDQNEVPVCTT